MTKSSAEVELEVEATRGQIDRTVEALKDKMQPKELFDEATRIMGGTSNKVLTTVVEQAKENPIPVALIGAGIAWLALSQSRKNKGYDPYTGQGYYETYEGYDENGGLKDKIKSKAREAVQAAKSGIHTAKDKVSGAVDTARTSTTDGVGTAKTRATGLMGSVQTRAGDLGHRAQVRYQETLDTEPLIIGAIGLAVGVAIGASFPATRTENRYIGPHRDKLVGRGRDLAKTSLDEARTVAERAYGQVKNELHRQTGPEGEGSTLKDKAKALADAGVSTVRDEVDTRLQH
ncbi:DUF3618 domain-containing protein [Phenylobacterium sp. J426]|uniref:DUF3618 domain-containing protein n=1 Tax=Phenylobacterium sp. J426 TaxID=2898439 RepID=UPI002150DF9F|nr:DUF3618 domain-containing protein [Phenylobacterium sp. J426]MCR5875095.1 DUF3618 domain-containing protein [Phenylobacterium sp. J426]